MTTTIATYETINVNGREFRVYQEDVCGMAVVRSRKEGFDSAESLLLSGEFAGTEISNRYAEELKNGRSLSILVKEIH